MSQATVEFVQRFFNAFDEHDESALLALVHPDVEFTSLILEVEGGFRGHDGVRLYLRELFATFPGFRVDVDEVSVIGHGAVVKVRVQTSGVASGVPTDLTDWLALTVQDGKAAWWAFYRTEAEALDATRARQ
jgi:ketosteroid isomerase-like protein